MEKVLTGVRVLDLSRWFAGPYAGTLLAQQGAEVIRVERPSGEDERHFGPHAPNGESMLTMITSQNREGITLNILSDKGKEILHKLVEQCDVVLHSYVVGSKEAEIASYEALKEVNPRIVVGSVSGFGSTGPYAQRPCFDTIAQALCGSMSYTGFPENPPTRSGVAWVDFSTGCHLALGVMFALFHRERTGKGQAVEAALLDVAVACVAGLAVAAEYKVSGYVRTQQGNASYYTFTDCMEAKDGWVMLGVTTNAIWRRFVRTIGRPEMKDDPRFKDDSTRFRNRDIIHPIVHEWTKARTMDEIVATMGQARIPCSRVNTTAEMVEDPQIRFREALVEMEYPNLGKVPIPGVAIKMSDTPGSVARRAPKPGENNEEVYSRLLGLNPEQLSQLKAEEVI
jgi:CoA:oxalate CoA-transferase